MFDDVGIQAALLQIVLRARVFGQLVLVKSGGGGGGVFQGLLLLFACRRGLRVGGGGRFGHSHTHAVGQVLHRFHKAQPLVFHNKAQRRAVGTAAEAVVKLLAGAYRKRRRFFFVKRAAGHVVGTAFFQRHLLVDNIDNIYLAEQLVDKVTGDHGWLSGCLKGSVKEINLSQAA